jgi:hypothetical protein
MLILTSCFNIPNLVYRFEQTTAHQPLGCAVNKSN